jgi:hypothetical protein
MLYRRFVSKHPASARHPADDFSCGTQGEEAESNESVPNFFVSAKQHS